MKNTIAFVLLLLMLHLNGYGQRNCGELIMLNALEAKHPGAKELFLKERAKANQEIASQKIDGSMFKVSSSILIPVVFHVAIDSITFKQIGGISGLEDRMYSQMEVINNDYNGTNADKVKVPSVWTSLFATVGIRFGLAKIDPIGNKSIGYELKIIPNGTSFDVGDGAKGVKFAASGGIDGWDNDKYLNIWITSIKSFGSNILGVTVPPSLAFGTKPEYGIVLNTLAFGVRKSIADVFINNIDKGRTLTHELGHFLSLAHTWGDDDGECFGSGGVDDGFSETPVEADATYNDPIFPRFDVCTPSGNGIMFMNYMDYTNDKSMYMFTHQQAAKMLAEVSIGGRSYSLTQYSYLGGDTEFKKIEKVTIFPNPSKGVVYIKYDLSNNPLKRIDVYNVWGQKVFETTYANITSIDLSNFSKGLYFVNCYFNNEIYKQKIILE